VLLDLSQGATMGASNAVAEQVLTSLRKLGPTHRGYVERANFVVLRSPDVPSILVETAFITNPSEEAKLKNPDHREKLASAILDGVNGYFHMSPPPGSYFAANNAAPSRHQASLTSRYIVNRGDTIRSIAEHHGLTIAQLREANDLAEDRVRPGEILQIPSG
jgi:N-acetylmuramoyl-L-alanine amidase